ncbi:MAG: ABC transporter permease [Pirellulales bacterium]
MFWIAWRMLIGNPGKYLGIVFGVAFASFLIAQQASIFVGLMNLTASQIRDVRGVDIWVCNPGVRFIDDNLPMSNTALGRIRGVSGVEWAVPFFKGLGRARMPDGTEQQMIILGLDNASFVGAPAPQDFFLGGLDDLRQADAVIVDDAGYKLLWPEDGESYKVGRILEMNDRRAVVVGVCKAGRTFQSFPIVYTRYSNAIQYLPTERRTLSYVLVKGAPDVPVEEVCRRIEAQTEFKAYPHQVFIDLTIQYFLKNTGIPVNFGMMVLMGFIVGAAVSGMLFYIFISDNIRQFGAAQGDGNDQLAYSDHGAVSSLHGRRVGLRHRRRRRGGLRPTDARRDETGVLDGLADSIADADRHDVDHHHRQFVQFVARLARRTGDCFQRVRMKAKG